MFARTPRSLVAPVVVTTLLMIACGGVMTTSPYDDANKNKGPSTSKEALEGKEFNKFFPKASAPFDMVAKQDKKGVSLYELKKDGKVVAELSITDTVSTPETRDKYKTSTEKIGNYPAAPDGSLGTAVLVADRFQVKVRTLPRRRCFSKEDREEWLKKFDLDGLAKLAK